MADFRHSVLAPAYRLYEGRRGNRDTPPDMHAPERADMSQQ